MFIVAFIPVKKERAVILINMFAIPTPAIIASLLRWPTKATFTTSINSEDIIDMIAGITALKISMSPCFTVSLLSN